MMASASPNIDYEYRIDRPGGGMVVATRAEGQTVINMDRSQEAPVPDGAMLVSSFLDQFEQHADIAEKLPGARDSLGEEIERAAGGHTLRTLRMRAGFSQAQVAAKLKTSQARISRLEARKEKATEEVLRGLCQVLSVDPNTLFEALARGDR